jgi:spore germination protein YaaH
VAPGKVVVALGNYAYDWHQGHADALTVEEAWLAAHDSGTAPAWDKASGNTGFAYTDDADADAGTPAIRHDVWMLDAATSWNQMQMLRHLGVGSVALWRLGSKTPASGTCSRPGTAAHRPRPTFRGSPRAAMSTWKAMARSCASI